MPFPFWFLSVFLAEQFESLQSHLDTMMPAAKKPFLQQFYSQVLFALYSYTFSQGARLSYYSN